MAQQLDEAGGALVSPDHRRPSAITWHTGVGTESIQPRTNATGPVRRSAGERTGRACDAQRQYGHRSPGWIVFAAGVRPRDELAVERGLELRGARRYPHRFTLCHKGSQHSHAIGAGSGDFDGRCYGLVGPGLHKRPKSLRTACSAAAAEFPRPIMSTKLKLLGVRRGELRRPRWESRRIASRGGQRTPVPTSTYAKLELTRRRQDTARRHSMVGEAPRA
jgi:nitrite reductase (NADH) large subunit